MSENKEEVSAVEEITGEKKGIKAKDASLVGKIVGGAEILLGSITLVILVCFGRLTADEAKTLFSIVLPCGFGVMAVFGTVDINLMLEKFSK